MPRYTYEDEDGTLFDHECSIAEHEEFLRDNPKVKQRLDNVYVATRGNSFDYHMDHGMKDMFRKIKKQYDRSTGHA